MRWEPPNLEGQNGVITGYKIRYRKLNRKGDILTTPSNLRECVLNNLDRDTKYQIRLWAINVNGTGPPTDWLDVETYKNDMDESRIPDKPYNLRGK